MSIRFGWSRPQAASPRTDDGQVEDGSTESPDLAARSAQQPAPPSLMSPSPEQVRASHILIHVDANAPADVAAAKAKLTALRQQLLDNKIDFAMAAKQYSQCPSAPTGERPVSWPRLGPRSPASASPALSRAR